MSTPTPGTTAAAPSALVPLAIDAHRIGAELVALAARLEAAGWKPDGHSAAELTETGKALEGMALRMAMHEGNTDLLTKLTGRQAHELTGPTG